MDDPSRAGSHLVRDPCLSPMDPMEMSCFDIRASTIPVPKRSMDSRASKRKTLASVPPHISLPGYAHGNGSWMATASTLKHSRLQHYKQESQLDQQMHHSTCLNLNADANSTESDLWILPDFDDWEAESKTQQQDSQSARTDGTWAPLLKRAVNSNRERLRRRLEGDGWDFVGGKYGDDGTLLKEEADASAESEESVDEEFDVVVLPVARVSC
ncbi:hypothetical protein BU23DRAFT_115723 [Bimuria novae-zelandiae CBS 107.79]|uniref:Uncharacterized protein n=1 Tax=Bimuria novae-zelandiae CBS 107.79 TaxID=1447943 RepID=A0A6A5VAB8_9PLEO|nr:hypothetical protein BU23DRAFT_115723 [Bimuria novae-zelandiae CBS 107.79]